MVHKKDKIQKEKLLRCQKIPCSTYPICANKCQKVWKMVKKVTYRVLILCQEW